MKTTQLPGLRKRFSRNIRLPLHMRLVGAIKASLTWDVPLKKEPTCKDEGHLFDLRLWKGHRNYCQECGAWIKNHEDVRSQGYYRSLY